MTANEWGRPAPNISARGGEKHGGDKKQARDEIGESGSAAVCYPGGRFDVGGDGTRADQRAERGSGGIAEEGAGSAGEFAVFHESALLADAHERADGIEHVEEEQNEQRCDEGGFQCAHDIEPAHDRREGGHFKEGVLSPDEARGEGDQARGDDAEQNRTMHFSSIENGGDRQPGQGDEDRPGCQIAQFDEGISADDDDAALFQADKGDEDTDADGGSEFQAQGDRVDNHFPDFHHRQDHEDHTADKDHAERDFPGYAALLTDIVGEKRVEPHARRQGDGIIGEQPHQKGRERRRQTGRADQRPEHDLRSGGAGSVHEGVGENGRVDEDDIGHRHKGGHAGEGFASERAALSGNTEKVIDPVTHAASSRLRRRFPDNHNS